MTTTKKIQTTAPLAHRVPAEVSDLINAYSAWLEEQTGVKIDPMSVYLGSQLRAVFQKTPENQKRIADEAKARAKRETDKAKARAEREAKAAQKAAEPKEENPAPRRPAKRVATREEHAADLAAATVHEADPNAVNGCTCGEAFANKGALTRHIRKHITPLIKADETVEASA
jgi:hypothetical protein